MAEVASSRASSRHLTPALSEKEAIKHEDLEPFPTAYPKVNGEDSIPTPPPESNQDTNDIKTRIKSENKAGKDDYQENGEESPSPDIDTKKTSSAKANAKSGSKPDTVPNATRKRGRPAKSELEGAALPAKAKRAKSTPEKKAGIKEEAQDERDTKPKDTQKSARGGRGGAGGTGGYSEEQDAYIRQLFTGSTKYSIKEVHQLYTEKFGDGKTPNSIKLRWYKLKNEGLVLTPFEVSSKRAPDVKIHS